MAERINRTALWARIQGQTVPLATTVTEEQLPTGAPLTIIAFAPDNPPLGDGDSVTIVTTTTTTTTTTDD